MADSVQLTDLDVITLYSIAVRTATADRDELIGVLRADLAWLEAGGEARPPVAREQIEFEQIEDASIDDVEVPAYAEDQPELELNVVEPEPEPEPEPVAAAAEPRPRAPIRRMAVNITPPAPRKTAAKKVAASKTVAKKAPVKKAPVKKSASGRGRS
jgi:hypothetical protein